MRIAAYLRVSTEDQTVDNQKPDIERYLAENPLYSQSEVIYFTENESAWKAGHQHELSRLMEEVRSGKRKYDMLIVWAFDRLTRGGSAALIRIYDFFLKRGVKVISIQERWSDVPEEFMPLMLAIFGMLAKKDSDKKSANTKAGMERAKKEGTKSGIPIGKRGKDKKPRRRAGYFRRYSRE